MKRELSGKRTSLSVAAALMIASGSPALAQQPGHGVKGQEFTGWSMPKACSQKLSTASGAASDQSTGQRPPPKVGKRGDARFLQYMMAEMQEMEGNFPTVPSGDPDVDYVRMTIPHHQGLMEASLRYLEDGEDKMIRKLAELFIAAQGGQIAVMCDWLEKHRPPGR